MLLAPISAILARLMRSSIDRHPSVLQRMGPAASARFLIDVTDAPMVLLLEPAEGRVRAHFRDRPPAHDATIHGRLSAFLAMLHGEVDGDALFFSGELTIDGDTGAVLALRNALDDAELDLTEELASLSARAAPMVRRLAALAERQTGLSLSRKAFPGHEDLA
ncbi:SCP2 sterol-binding domain-containing protein [Paracoccus sp. (in: a-proteobacteria)]|uniref:ubiquinone anaerobic biosynthesis accessory factor UbiT n=1 Tax=Paracoccus sp. TaxID=267 RepID=UPI00321FDD77